MFVCKICKEKYSSLEGLYSHLEEEHSAQIPPDMSTAHFYYYLKTGREHGNCVMCKQPTTFNEKTKKYNRFCNDPVCKMKYKEIVDKRMIGVYGKVNLLNDPNHQRKMLMNRSISGLYNFKGVDKPYVGSYELDFLKTMDLFFDWDPSDIVSPSPHTYYYVYEGEKHFYIPDFYIMSLGLEIEVKDGGDNPNMHHKIQDVDKEKEKLKDKVMHTQKINHYIKITNKNYYNLFEFFRISKEYVEKYGDYEKIPKIILDEDIKSKTINSSSKSKMSKEVNKAVNESYVSDVDILKLNGYEPVEEGYVFSKDNLEFNIKKFGKENNILFITGLSGSGKSTIIKQYAEKYNAENLEFDAITSTLKAKYRNRLDKINRSKINPIILEYLDNEDPEGFPNFEDPKFNTECVKFLDWLENRVAGDGKLYILEGMQIFLCFNPERFIGKPMIIMGTSMVKSMYRSTKRYYNKHSDDIKDCFVFFIKTLKRSGKYAKNVRQLDELADVIGESYEPVEEGYSINGFKKIDISKESIEKYKSSCKGLSHIRTGKDYEGRIFIDPNNDVVGFYNLRKSDHYIQGIEINKKYQSKGLGKMLLQECINSGAERLSVNKNNIKAINMYKKDFKIVNEDKNMYYMELKNNNKIHVEESYEPVEEGYVFSKDNLYINFEKFESGKSNICLITGLSGSGKSTLGKQLANKYHAEYVELDTFYNIGTVSYEDLNGTIYKEYADENKKDYEWLVSKKKSMNQIPNDLVIRMMQWVIRYCKKNKNKKYILEGVQIYSHGDAKVIKNEPLILINASMIKSIYQRHKREDSNNVNWKTQLKELPEIVRWYVDDEKQYNKFKKEIVEESFVIDHLKKHIDKKTFNQQLKDMVIINDEDFNKYNNEISKCVKSIQTLLKQEIPGCVFDDSKITHVTSNKNGYEFNMYFMTFLLMNEKNFKKFANKSKNKNIRNANAAKDCAKDLRNDIENRIIKPIRKLGFKEDEEYSQLASTKFINGNRFITIDVTDSLHCEINLDASFVIKKDIVEESYVCFPLLNSIISSKYDDIKSKEQYKRDVNAFKQHFLKGISRIDNIDDAKAMKGDLQALMSYLNGVKYTNNYSEFKNIDAVKEIEAWICRVAIPELDLKINKYSRNLEPVNEYAHNITFAINNNLQRGIFGLMDNISSITIDDSIQLKRKNTVMQVITENLKYDDNTTIIKFGTDKDLSLNNDLNNNIGSYLNWNKNNGINALLKNVSDELFNSKISIDDFHKIEGGDE